MRQASSLLVFAIVLAGSFSMTAGQSTRRAPSAVVQIQPSKVVESYCAACHDGRRRSPSGTLLEELNAERIPQSLDVWSRAYRQLQAGAMPPVGYPRPDRQTYDALLASIEQAWNVAAKPMPTVTGQQIAGRLATLLWNSAPDASLLQDARNNRLSDPAVIERQVRRMLADERAAAFVSTFLFPYLELDKLRNADPDKKHFPDYEPSLRDSLARETELFLLSQLRDDRDPIELWSANYTFLNEQLARHYGVSGVSGSNFRRVQSTPERAGLLGHGSVHMVTSRHQHGVDAGYTTPAARSKWIRLQFFGAPMPNGFPGAQPVKPELPITPQTRSLPVEPCVTCHRNFFPLGYALENFDPLGRWRTHDQSGPVDVSGAFVDGTPTGGVVELRRVLLQWSDAFRTTLTERLLLQAGGSSRGTPETLIRARQILRGLEDTRWSSLIVAVVRS
jgi:hypothetical protein